MNRLTRSWLLLLWLAFPGAGVLAADLPAGEAPSRLRLSGESFVDGRLLSTASGGPLAWEAPGFARPLQFPLDHVLAVDFPAAGELAPAGEWGLELVGGQVLYGELLGVDGALVRWNSVTPAQALEIDRHRVQRVFRQNASSRPLFVGPNGLQGWQSESPQAKVLFREEAGHLVASTPAQLIASWSLPTRFVCELEAAWGGKASWALQVQVENSKAERQTPFELALLDQALVLLHDLPGNEDLVWLERVETSGQMGRLRLYVDLEQAHFIATTLEGQPLAELRAAKTLTGSPRLRLLNRDGTFRLERLSVLAWDGTLPQVRSKESRQMVKAGDRELAGQVTEYNPTTREWVVTTPEGASRIPAADITSVWLEGDAPPVTGGVIVAGFDGTRLQGELAGIDDSSIELRTPGIDAVVKLARERVKSLLPVRSVAGAPGPASEQRPPVVAAKPVVAPEGARLGWLRGPGLQLQGWLVETPAAELAGGLYWQSAQATAPAPLASGLTGHLVYREPLSAAELAKKRREATEQAAANNPGDLGGMARAMVGMLVPGMKGKRGAQAKNRTRQPLLHLRTGDVLTCTQVQVGEQGVEFESPTTSARKVSHDRIKVLELLPADPEEVRLARRRRDPLLTLPRMQRPSPPTQLVRAVTGDFMRGRVVDLNSERLKIEVRLEEQEIPREVVSHIFWLHPDELEGATTEKRTESAQGGLLVQAKRNEGFRQTFVAGSVKEGKLRGTSDLLGECEVEIDSLDQVLLGAGIDVEVSKLAYHRWRLKNATDPRYVSAGDEEGGEADGDDGKGSRLVGKPAPDFKLALLEGGEFQLAKARGRVVVLDFWATWCGPCIKAMPMVERAVGQFPAEQVQLIAVNLQEQPKAIRAMLERHQLNVAVALDVDGVAAERYEASAIPQTVVIDSQGKIARLFVGGSNDLEEKIAGAIRELLPTPAQ